jgi:two-component system response regulator AtoC
MAKILIVDDEESIRSFIAESLSGDKHSTIQAESAEEALRVLSLSRVDLVITDVKMPGMGGIALLQQIKEQQLAPHVLMLTAFGTVELAVEAMKLGASDFLQKPPRSPAALRATVKNILERRETAKAQPTQETPLSYGDPNMRPVVETLTKVARTDTTALLLGESGTGKEVAAQFIHRMSTRKNGPFVAINCAALSETLLASELFGHEKGAFTGANERHKGRIEQADGGSFFLDEVAELKPELQAKLLRVLQERRFERVGGTQTIEANVRFIAATNRNLRAMMEEGKLREDLYHRLAVFPIRLPPLRERKNDIIPLSLMLLKKISQSMKINPLKLTEDACRKLSEWDWPGNIRELENTLSRAAILVEGDTIHAKNIWFDTNTKKSADAPKTLQELEQEALITALKNANGNRRIAAESLGIGLRTLYDKMKRFGID